MKNRYYKRAFDQFCTFIKKSRLIDGSRTITIFNDGDINIYFYCHDSDIKLAKEITEDEWNDITNQIKSKI